MVALRTPTIILRIAKLILCCILFSVRTRWFDKLTWIIYFVCICNLIMCYAKCVFVLYNNIRRMRFHACRVFCLSVGYCISKEENTIHGCYLAHVWFVSSYRPRNVVILVHLKFMLCVVQTISLCVRVIETYIIEKILVCVSRSLVVGVVRTQQQEGQWRRYRLLMEGMDSTLNH